MRYLRTVLGGFLFLAGVAMLDCGDCKPNCEDKKCGSDGCGGSCGTCEDGSGCYEDAIGPSGWEPGLCYLTCEGLCAVREAECGHVPHGPPWDDMDCPCGDCPPGEVCARSGVTTSGFPQKCLPPTEVCMSAGANALFCDKSQVCFGGECCTPHCPGKECGDDSCGGSCGTCPDGHPNCIDFVCQ